MIRPARERGATLWPFDGALSPLAASGGLILAESYPGDAYRQIGLPRAGWAKRRREDRAALADLLLCVAARHRIILGDALRDAVRDGFPRTAGADDGFDAFVGLLAALAVANGRHPPGDPGTDAVRRWEGWILGRSSAIPT